MQKRWLERGRGEHERASAAVMEVVGMAAARVAETAARAPRWWKLEGGKFRNAGTNESW